MKDKQKTQIQAGDGSVAKKHRNTMLSSTLDKRTVCLFFLPAGIFMAVFLLFPLLKLFYDSLFNVGDNYDGRTFVGLKNYIKAFTSSQFLADSWHTLIYVIIAVGFETILGLALAVILTNKYRGFKAIRTFILSPLMIAPLVAGLVWKFMLSSQFGIVNTLLVKLGVIHSTSSILWLSDSRLSLISCIIADIWLTTPFMMLMFLAGIQSIPSSLYESAAVEGANKWQIVIHIIIPNIRGVLFSALVIRVIDAARTFDIIWAMTQGGPQGSSELLSVLIYKMLQRYGDVGYASAMAVIFIVVLIAITLLSQRKQNKD
ncbi:sugar ABC transporter permease [Bifidobacterium sp. ESL0775]|uniref:carbohydrate ABC transporter permease n=1 Tax=Bifidobacterium sp. ESL0775 TaxID=2983230 RepID=UPI0023F81FAD|nr:sugar ABC transporter permease [Bifidobacterium sp. ESL0775]WEV69074.1 sugar ABC transporter permease [Bifidobacterium sp. ESL0775]